MSNVLNRQQRPSGHQNSLYGAQAGSMIPPFTLKGINTWQAASTGERSQHLAKSSLSLVRVAVEICLHYLLGLLHGTLILQGNRIHN